jgi:hypothetical protein
MPVVLPQVRLLFACDDASYDPDAGKWKLTHPWSIVELSAGAEFPVIADEFRIYAQLTGGLGSFRLMVELRQLLDNGEFRLVSRGPPIEIRFTGSSRLEAIDGVLFMQRIPLREEGLYEFSIVAESEPPRDPERLEGLVSVLRVLR